MKTFNAGDWVRYKGIAKINSITHTGYHLSNGYITSGDNGEMKHWVVKIGEWCWVGKQLRQLKSIIKEEYRVLYEFKNIERDMDGYETYHYVLESQLEGYTQPFIGELPTFLDEVKENN